MPVSQAIPLPMPFSSLGSAWTDSGSASMQSWLEWQRLLWQPWWDLQAQWLQPWLAVWPAMAGWPGAVRGTEQLG